MQGPKLLFACEDHWETHMGAFLPGERRAVFRGKDVFQGLKNFSWTTTLLYGITGRTFTEQQIRYFEGSWVLSTTYPDPRIWNNRIAALAGTTRSTAALALHAANAVSEASLFGQRPIIRAIDFFIRTQKQISQGTDLEQWVKRELTNHKIIYGYGRPVIEKDERIDPVLGLAQEMGLCDGPHLKLAFAVEKILLQHRRHLYMNVVAILAAIAADQGFDHNEFYRFMLLRFSAGILPCYIDAADKPEGTLLPVRCERLAYNGPKRRTWINEE
jgi:hypothetical protein